MGSLFKGRNNLDQDANECQCQGQFVLLNFLTTVHNTTVQNYGMKLLFIFLTKHFINSLSLSLSLSNCNGICYLFSCMLQYLSLILDVYACMKVTQICSVLLLLLISIVIFGCVVWLCSFFRGSFIWLNARYQYWVNLIYCCCVYDSGSATQCYGLYLE